MAQGPAHDACSEVVSCKVQRGIHPLSISSRAGYTLQVGEWRRQKKLHRRCTEHLLRLDQRNRTSVCVGIYIKGLFFFFARSLFCDRRGWLGRYETHRAGCRAGILQRSWSCRTGRVSSSSRKPRFSSPSLSMDRIRFCPDNGG